MSTALVVSTTAARHAIIDTIDDTSITSSYVTVSSANFVVSAVTITVAVADFHPRPESLTLERVLALEPSLLTALVLKQL